ncbi:30S ribosomal protein S8e [Nanoarchaeota archaeon]
MARKITGGRYIPLRKKKLTEVPGKPRLTTLAKDKHKLLKTRGGKSKMVLLTSESVIVMDPKTKKMKKAKITEIVRSPANRYFKTQMVKGTIIKTDLGKARITSRPGQEGSISAVLVEE